MDLKIKQNIFGIKYQSFRFLIPVGVPPTGDKYP